MSKKFFLYSILAGLMASMALFILMALMIRPSGEFKRDRSADSIIQFIRMRDDSSTQLRDRKPPEKPETQEKLPEPKMEVAQQEQADRPNVDFDTPRLNLALSDIGQGPGGIAVNTGGGSAGSGDSAPAPLVRIEPQYPREAAMNGVEGWVRVRFDISMAGEVENAEVIESQPRRIFDSAAKAAVLRWRYRPQVVDGKPMALESVIVQLDFKLKD